MSFPVLHILHAFILILSSQVILATNIAETSVTIPGIRYVVDSGLMTARAFNSHTGVDALVVVPVAKAQARQRR